MNFEIYDSGPWTINVKDRGVVRTTQTSKMEHFAEIVNDLKAVNLRCLSSPSYAYEGVHLLVMF